MSGSSHDFDRHLFFEGNQGSFINPSNGNYKFQGTLSPSLPQLLLDYGQNQACYATSPHIPSYEASVVLAYALPCLRPGEYD
jgi:hypothetical protein